jgi:hypothetical protein
VLRVLLLKFILDYCLYCFYTFIAYAPKDTTWTEEAVIEMPGGPTVRKGEDR